MIDFSKIKDDEKNYFVISINYEKENGINIFNTLEEYKEKIDNNFYKLYIFNENRMYSYINDEGDIFEEYVSKENVKEFYTREYYLEKEYKKLLVTYIIDENDNRNFYYSGLEK